MTVGARQLSFEEQISRLRRVPRTGWLIRGVEHPESVADHIFGTLVLAMLFDDRVKPYPAPTVPLPLVHDIQEISTGDLTHRTKLYVPSYPEFERAHFYDLVATLPEKSRKWLRSIWDEFEAEETPRARTTHIIDVVEMLSQAYEYEKTGQRKLDEFWQWVPRCAPVPPLFELARAIERKRFFLRTGANFQYQHFEATEHHAGKDFAEKLRQLDRNAWTERDNVVRDCFRRRVLQAKREAFRVLDVGCGIGSFSRFFVEQDDRRSQVVGIDINLFLLEEAQKRWQGRTFKGQQADIGWYWDFESESFDVVLVGEVLGHLFDPWFVMKEAFRVLRPDGLLLISVPNSFHKDKVSRMVREERIELRYREEHIRYFSPSTLAQLMRETGFRVEEMWGLTHAWDRSFQLSLSANPSSAPSLQPQSEVTGDGSANEDAWTLVACGVKMSRSEIDEISSVQGPGRLDPFRPLADWITDHNATKEWAKIHAFLEEINKAKLLKVDVQALPAETIAQQTFRIAAMSCCITVERSQTDPDLAAATAIRCALIQGIVESHLAEFALGVRAGLDSQIRRRALKDILGRLSGDLVDEYLSVYDVHLLGSDEGMITRSLLRRDYERLGASTAGNGYFALGLPDGAEILLARLTSVSAE